MSNLFFNFLFEAMAELTLGSEKLVPAEKKPESKQVIDRICDLLKIAKLEIVFQIAETSNMIFMQNEVSTIFSRDGCQLCFFQLG